MTGYIYNGIDHAQPQPAEVVLKLEAREAPKKQMHNEWKIYANWNASGILQAGGIPAARLDKGVFTADSVDKVPDGIAHVETPMLVLSMERLGENLMQLCKRNGKLTLKSVLMLGVQCVELMQQMHSLGYIHRDVKPENFCIGRAAQQNKVFVIDFGLACSYRQRDGQHLPDHADQSSSKFLGSIRYASLHAHMGGRQSRRCDLQSVGYMLTFLLNGKLPWQVL